MGRRTLLLLASILVAAAGTALIWVYVQGADTRAQQAEQNVPVLVATAAIDIGTDAGSVQAQGLASVRMVPQRLVPDHAVSAFAQIAGRSATVLVLKGEYLISDQFQAVGSTSGVPRDKVAVTVPVGDANRVAGLLHPDIHIAIYYVDVASAAVKPVNGSVKVLLNDVRVLAVGNTTVVRNALGQAAQIGTQGGVTAADVTLEVAPDQAKAIIMASTKGSLWFTVLGSEAAKPPADDGITGNDLPIAKGTRG
jgi:pilus assembly protein CpaB